MKRDAPIPIAPVRSKAAFRVEDRQFVVWFSKSSPDSFAAGCEAEERASPIAAAVSRAWIHDPAQLLEAVDTRAGLSFEGEVSFEYGDDPEEALPPGVTAFGHGERETVTADFFERFVIECALAHLDAAARVGLDLGASFRADLLARRHRLARGARRPD